MGGADGFVGAAAADKGFFGGEVGGADVSGYFLDDFQGFVELFPVAGGFLALVVLEIVKD